MTSSSLNPSLNSNSRVTRFVNDRRLSSVQKKNQKLVKPVLACICFLMCIVIVPERPTKLASICEKYNSSNACAVW